MQRGKVARNFPDFLTAFCAYARNQYAPENFTLWAGISLIAAVLERKVWIAEGREQDGSVYHNYPNLFVLLTAGPGVGKSSAIGQVMPLLYGLEEKINPKFKHIEGVVTAAGLRTSLTLDTLPSGEKFCGVYCVGSEGSDSPLKNHGDDFRSMACSMYDCPEKYQFTTGKDGSLKFPLPVMNMLVGVTFDFLGSVVDQNSVFGGLASRMTYVIEKENKLSGDFFGNVDISGEETVQVERPSNGRMRDRLLEDLGKIHRMYGKMLIQRNVMPIVDAWYEEFKKDFNDMESERMKSLLIRQRTLLKKILIIIAASSGDDLLITAEHAERAVDLVRNVTKDNPYILAQSATANVDSQKGTTQFIAQVLKRNGGKMSRSALKASSLSKGNGVDMLTKTFDYLIGAGWIKVDSDDTVHLLIDPDRYL